MNNVMKSTLADHPVFSRAGVTSGETLLAFAIYATSDPDGWCRVGQLVLSQVTRTRTRTVRINLERLIEKGMVEAQRSFCDQRMRCYRLKAGHACHG